MVWEVIKEKSIGYLHSKGLTKEDVGKVIGIFFFAKYLTFLSVIPICYKFQPIRRFLKPSTYAREYFIGRRTRFQQSQVMSSINARAKSYRDWLRKNGFDERKEQGKAKMAEVKKKVQRFVGSKKEQFVQQQRQSLLKQKIQDPHTWRVRLFAWTERVAEKAEKNERWRHIAASLKVPPKLLAYAIGEGLVFYKITSPIWMPLELLCIVKYLQWKRRRQEEGG